MSLGVGVEGQGEMQVLLAAMMMIPGRMMIAPDDDGPPPPQKGNSIEKKDANWRKAGPDQKSSLGDGPTVRTVAEGRRGRTR